jgi:hypothetical protein
MGFLSRATHTYNASHTYSFDLLLHNYSFHFFCKPNKQHNHAAETSQIGDDIANQCHIFTLAGENGENGYARYLRSTDYYATCRSGFVETSLILTFIFRSI